MQHWQSSPHQQGSLTGGFAIGLLAIEEEDEVVEVADVVVVEGGMIVCVPREVWRLWLGLWVLMYRSSSEAG